jgi:2-aminoadipate transaminase
MKRAMKRLSSPVTMASRIDRLASSAIGSVLRLAGSADMIALAAGSPAPETFGAAEVSEIMNRILTTPDPLQYGEAEGMWVLREWIAANQSNLLGRDIGPARTVLTHGSQQALDLLCKALLDPGDVVLVDRPSYVGALQVFNLFQATLVPVPIVEDDNLDQLDTALRRGLRPKLLYVVPNFANPTGLTVSARQRERLVELATRHGFVVVEDDPYGELYYGDHGERPPAVAALSEEVVRIGSFSKVLFPAARLGYLTAPQPLVDVLIKLKQAADLVNSNLMQRIVYELVSTPRVRARPAARLAQAVPGAAGRPSHVRPRVTGRPTAVHHTGGWILRVGNTVRGSQCHHAAHRGARRAHLLRARAVLLRRRPRRHDLAAVVLLRHSRAARRGGATTSHSPQPGRAMRVVRTHVER